MVFFMRLCSAFLFSASSFFLNFYKTYYSFLAKGSKVTKKLYVTDGTKEAFPGLGMFFLRITNKPITTANVAQEVFFGVLESNGGGLLGAIESLLVQVFIPALQQQTNWGTLSSDANSHILKEAFMGKLSQFVSMLSNARASIADAVTLTACPHPQLAAISSPSEILTAAGNSELVEAAEACTQTWCREIEQVGLTDTPTPLGLQAYSSPFPFLL